MLGRNHSLLKRLRTLRRDGARRREEGVYLAEGTHLAVEAIEAARLGGLVLPAISLQDRHRQPGYTPSDAPAPAGAR